jgi:hypothetical protein
MLRKSPLLGLTHDALVARRKLAPFLWRYFAAFFWDDGFAAAGAVGPDRLLEEGEDQACGAGDHQDQADGVEADALGVDVGRVAEDGSYCDQEYGSSDGHPSSLPHPLRLKRR